MKTNKQLEEQILAKKKKNENEICPGTAAKKDTTGCNNCYTKTEKSQNQTTENGKKRDNKKSSWKRDIQKQIKLKDRERQCKRRKNLQKICLPMKDKKSLHKRNVAKISKLQERTRQCEKRKNLQKECVFNEGNNYNVEENINFIHNEETHVKSVKNYEKRQVLNIVKEKKRIKEQQRRNCNTLQINTNVKSRNFKKKLHVSTILQKQNLANTLKSYAMCNLRTKYKILQRVKIMRQKQISKGIKNNRKSITLTQCLKVFNQKTSTGPVYVCTVCLQTWFRTSVQDVANLTFKSQLEKKTYLECSQGYVSADSKQWLCNTCRLAIKKERWPKLSIINGMGFPPVPTELKLYGMEECIICPRLLFFQMRTHFMGGRTRVLGNVVNIPVDVAHTVQTLPRTLSDTETLVVKYKRKLEYKKCEFRENIRPYAVWKATRYLLQNSNIYKNENIQLNTDWLNSISDDSGSLIKEVEVFDPISEHLSNDDETDIIAESHSAEAMTSEKNVTNVGNSCNDNIQKPSDVEHMNTEINNDKIELIDMNEVDEDSNAIHRDTLLHEEDIPHADPKSFPHELIFAPGEGHRPMSIFQDADVEYLAFPTIFCGQRRKENRYKVNYSDVCKYELRSVDRRVATNVPNVFFKFKKIQMKSVMAKKSLLMRRCKRKGKDICARDVLDDDERAKIVRLNEGYYIFKDIHNSPAYLAKKKKEAFAMIRQLKTPALFISQSAAETKWPELLRALGQTVDNKTYTDTEIAQMDFETKSRLIRGDSATLVRYFDHRFNVFLKDVIFSKCKPIGEITDYF